MKDDMPELLTVLIQGDIQALQTGAAATETECRMKQKSTV